MTTAPRGTAGDVHALHSLGALADPRWGEGCDTRMKKSTTFNSILFVHRLVTLFGTDDVLFF